MPENIVNEEQHVLTLFVAEVLLKKPQLACCEVVEGVVK
jgi:hypothetical protein